MGKLPQRLPRASLHTTRTKVILRSSVSFATNVFPSHDSILSGIFERSQRYQHTLLAARNMSSDADYASFLDKANQDTGSVAQQDASKKSFGTKSVNTAVPKALEQVEEYYTSDADEPFEPVALTFDGGDVSADDLKKLIGGDKNVEEVKQKTFESQYSKVIDAVKKAGNGQVKVFKVDIDRTRAEFYVVTVDEKEDRIVGLKALSVES
ncbi:hypothetical protein BKA66DRAFT_458282 [Pyrenochaeta sp. MPI-SDFR-AT-0127]|nr:hypothetical protein BKA66DRAFT_458282 [Pyrenochaeta sp. MPI-SDFR-AT-0127]